MKYTKEQLLAMLAEVEKEQLCNALGQINSEWYFIDTTNNYASEYRYNKEHPYLLEDWCYFTTLEQAKAFDERQMAIKRIWDWSKDNDDFEPDWKDCDQEKYSISYDHEDETLMLNESTFYQYQSELPHFSSKEKLKQCIEQNEQDLLTILRIK